MVALSEISNMFWGLTLDGGKRYTQTVHKTFHISMAALEMAQQQGAGDKHVAVMLQHEKTEFLLCTLEHGKMMQQALDLNFNDGEEVTFFLNGKGVVHLTGYLLSDDDDLEMEDSDGESDEEIPQLRGMKRGKQFSDEESEEEEDEIPHGKQRKKQKLRELQKKARLMADSDSEEEYDSELDTSYGSLTGFLNDECEEGSDEDDSDDEDFIDDDSEDSEMMEKLARMSGSLTAAKQKTPKGTPQQKADKPTPKTAEKTRKSSSNSVETPSKKTKGTSSNKQQDTPSKKNKQNSGTPKQKGDGSRQDTPSKKNKGGDMNQNSDTPKQKGDGSRQDTPSKKNKGGDMNQNSDTSKQKGDGSRQDTPRPSSQKKKNKGDKGTPVPGGDKTKDQAKETPPLSPSTSASPVGDEPKRKKKRKKKKDQESPGHTDSTQDKSSPAPAKAAKKVLEGGIISEDKKEGHGPAAKPGKTVHVYYTGRLQSGKLFDSSTSGKPFKFKLGKNEVIRGWDLGLDGMKVGSKRKLTIPPKMGYGAQRMGDIPANSTLVFDVEMKAVS